MRAASEAVTDTTKAVISHTDTNPSGIVLYHISI
jgi:hypothetical protein